MVQWLDVLHVCHMLLQESKCQLISFPVYASSLCWSLFFFFALQSQNIQKIEKEFYRKYKVKKKNILETQFELKMFSQLNDLAASSCPISQSAVFYHIIYAQSGISPPTSSHLQRDTGRDGQLDIQQQLIHRRREVGSPE